MAINSDGSTIAFQAAINAACDATSVARVMASCQRVIARITHILVVNISVLLKWKKRITFCYFCNNVQHNGFNLMFLVESVLGLVQFCVSTDKNSNWER